MEKIQLVQEIGNEVCESCGHPDMDCGDIPKECPRIISALNWLEIYTSDIKQALIELRNKWENFSNTDRDSSLEYKKAGKKSLKEFMNGQICARDFCVEDLEELITKIEGE